MNSFRLKHITASITCFLSECEKNQVDAFVIPLNIPLIFLLLNKLLIYGIICIYMVSCSGGI